MSRSLTWFYDPGHAWLQVDKQTLAEFDLTPMDFSRYSYIDGNNLYLEEDCDAYKFILAVGEIRFKTDWTTKERKCDDQFNVRAMRNLDVAM